jgi:hypothetical protein
MSDGTPQGGDRSADLPWDSVSEVKRFFTGINPKSARHQRSEFTLRLLLDVQLQTTFTEDGLHTIVTFDHD